MAKVILVFLNFANASVKECRGIFCDAVNWIDRNAGFRNKTKCCIELLAI
jgi:hypothetical protein